jgi:hypothetical protein
MDDDTKKTLAKIGMPTLMLGIGITVGSLAGGNADDAKVMQPTVEDRTADGGGCRCCPSDQALS